MTTIFDVLLQALRNLEATWEGAATGGSTSTIVDSRMADSAQFGFTANDEFNGGWAFITHTSDGLTPERSMPEITDYVASTGTITVSPTMSGAVEAGDYYALVTRRYPRIIAIAKLREALTVLGDVPTEDTSLETEADTREYEMPLAAKRDLRKVFIATNTTQPYAWQPVTQYTVIPAGPGDEATLLLPYTPTAERKLKLVYMAAHPAVNAPSDEISDYLGADLLGADVALRLARWRLHQPGTDAERQVSLINDLMTRLQTLKSARRHDGPPIAQQFPYLPD